VRARADKVSSGRRKKRSGRCESTRHSWTLCEYQKIPVLATMYPSRDELTAVQPDFVFAAYPGAFAPEAAGRRADLGPHSYVSPSSCPEDARSARISMPVIFRELREIGTIACLNIMPHLKSF
jgi:hypothetical protein